MELLTIIKQLPIAVMMQCLNQGLHPLFAAPRSAVGVLQEGNGARAAGAEARPGRPLQGTGVPVLDQRVSWWKFKKMEFSR